MIEVPWGPVTVTSTTPLPPGETAVIEVSELTLNEAAGLEPNATALAPVNCTPVSLTDVPPAGGPVLGCRPVTTGALVYVKLPVFDLPPVVVTCTKTGIELAVPGGVTAEIESAVSPWTWVAGTPPKVTEVGSRRLVPMILTVLPPAAGPEFGRTVLMSAPGTLTGADPINSDGWVQGPGGIAVPLTTTATLPVVPVDRLTDLADELAVNEGTEPVAVSGSDAGAGVGTEVRGMVKVAIWLAGEPPIESIPMVKVPLSVLPARAVSVVPLKEVLRAKLERLKDPPGATVLGEMTPVTVTGKLAAVPATVQLAL